MPAPSLRCWFASVTRVATHAPRDIRDSPEIGAATPLRSGAPRSVIGWGCRPGLRPCLVGGPDGELRARVEAEFAQAVRDMRLHRLLHDEEGVGNLSVALPCRDQAAPLPLSPRQMAGLERIVRCRHDAQR